MRRLNRNFGLRLISLKDVLAFNFKQLKNDFLGVDIPLSQEEKHADFTQPILSRNNIQILQQIQQIEPLTEQNPIFSEHQSWVLLYIVVCFNKRTVLRHISNTYIRQFLSNLSGKQYEVIGDIMEKMAVCACCGYQTISMSDTLCSVCYWEESFTRKLDASDQFNGVTLGEARLRFEQYGSIFLNSQDLPNERFQQYKRPLDWQQLRDQACPIYFDEDTIDLATREQAIQAIADYYTLNLSAQEMCDFINSQPALSPDDLEYFIFSETSQKKLLGDEPLSEKDLDPACYFWCQTLYLKTFLNFSDDLLKSEFLKFNAKALELITF